MARRNQPDGHTGHPAPEEERRASPRALAAAGIVALILIGGGLALGLLLSDDPSESAGTEPSTGTTATGARTLPAATEVAELFAGIPQQGNALGSPSAPVTMVEYLDVQCPFCQEFGTQAMPKLIDRYVRSGKLRMEVRPLGSLGPDSQRGRLAMIAAGRQDKLFELTHVLFLEQGVENSGWLSDELIEAAAASIDGLDTGRFDTDLRSAEVLEQGSAYDAASRVDTVAVTPTILVGKTGGRLNPVNLAAASDPEPIANAIEAALG